MSIQPVAAELRRFLRYAGEIAERIAQSLADFGPGVPFERLSAAGIRVWIQDFYQALEDLMKCFLGDVNGEVPHGADSHKVTLERCFPVPDRPGWLWSPEVRADLDELRQFRHYSYHGYAVPLDPEQVRANAERVARLMPLLARDVDTFAERVAAAEREPAGGDGQAPDR